LSSIGKRSRARSGNAAAPIASTTRTSRSSSSARAA
jgi:hypothetical protein